MNQGHKAANLAQIPEAWVPPYFVIPYDNIIGRDLTEAAHEIVERCEKLSWEKILIRSSAINETLNQRGRFESREVRTLASGEISTAITGIMQQARSASTKMALVVQVLLEPTRKGHFSNERRVSSTRNQWEIEVERPRFDSFRTNSQRDKPADPKKPLQITDARALQRLFGSVGSWANAQFDSRIHFEWVIEGDRLWLVQIDLEDDAPDDGMDPWAIEPMGTQKEVRRPAAAPLYHWSTYPDRDFRKVQSIEAFAKHSAGGYPNIFVLSAVDAHKQMENLALESILRECIGQRLVCRTDVRPATRGKMQGLNLPRTDTSEPSQVVSFIGENIENWNGLGLQLSDAIFIIHEYLPATTGAWAEAAPHERTVSVDALWGLPDGLQYLDHDSFEFDLKVDQVVSENIRYKSWFVAEDSDGIWRRKAVRRELTRHSSIGREDVEHIAKVTHQLSREAGTPLRVMWFVDVKKEGISRLFPWFAHRPEQQENGLLSPPAADQSVTRALPVASIKSPDDLSSIPAGRMRLRLDPDAQYMRDNDLLEKLAGVAKAQGHVVEVRGSGLCHAYYLLKSMGVAVMTPHARRYTRVRGRQTFGKVVRDGIPDRIVGRGERVRSFTLSSQDRRKGLAAKLIEEAQEVANSTNASDIASELADVHEVVRSIAKLENVEWSEVESRADQKRAQVGSFEGAKFLVETDIPPRVGKPTSKKGTTIEPYEVRRQDSGVLVPFLALLDDGTEFYYEGRAYLMRLRSEGVYLEEIDDGGQPQQLKLPFDGAD